MTLIQMLTHFFLVRLCAPVYAEGLHVLIHAVLPTN